MITPGEKIPVLLLIFLWPLFMLAQTNGVPVDHSKHKDLVALKSDSLINVLYSKGYQAEAK